VGAEMPESDGSNPAGENLPQLIGQRAALGR